jgi:hypothetical protein
MINRILMAALLATSLVGCGEKAQTVQPSMKKSDGKAWEGVQNGFAAEGWKAGDKASWESELHQRMQGQNEYSRAPAPK